MFLHLCFFSATHSPSFFHRVPPLRYRTPLAHREHNGPGSCTQLLDGASNTRPAPPSPSIQSLRCNWHSEVQWDEAATGPSPYCALLPPLPPPRSGPLTPLRVSPGSPFFVNALHTSSHLKAASADPNLRQSPTQLILKMRPWEGKSVARSHQRVPELASRCSPGT